ncbi:transcription factor bHLH120-like [Humulus lupulus]|uniref:transcription factor bHLH120-like n=1 Tax=Humulus lupulus TaxID=3486 RepID=UPI002B416C93|nr:transcription factor bHLH120-like [Humulus lupulus]
MFPNLHRSEELCFQISPNPQKKNRNSSEDQILDHASLEDNAFYFNNYKEIITSSQCPKSLPNCCTLVNHNSTTVTHNSSDNKSKKMRKHRDIEMQRRQEMAARHASLRSLLPLELIKGKRSISDHIHEGARYIKQLQLKIKELDAKRENLKKYYYLSDSRSIIGPSTYHDHHGHGGAGSSSSSTPLSQDHLLRVQPCGGGLEIVISSTGDFGGASVLPLSKILQVILQEGLCLISCISTKVNGRLLHTIKSEANYYCVESECSDYLSALEQKLKKLIIDDDDDP